VDANSFVSRRNTFGRNENFHIVAARGLSLKGLQLLIVNLVRRSFG
jgi:hypothetical protein